MLTTEERDNLVKYKLERAKETWNEIVGIVDGGYWYAAANRMYYACYYIGIKNKYMVVKYIEHYCSRRSIGMSYSCSGSSKISF